MPERTDLRPLDAPVPPNVTETFGYTGDARYVAFYWSPAGDELVYEDGRLGGTGEWHAFLTYVHHRTVAPHLAGYNFGSSDEDAEHWLLIDRGEHRAYAGTVADVHRFLQRQHPPTPALTPEQTEKLTDEIRRVFTEGLHEVPSNIDTETIHQRMAEQQHAVEEMVSFLDQANDTDSH